jgi:phosphate transport system permease protein
VEGPRRAADRTVTTVVTAMFVAAMVPLVSLIWTVLTRGSGRVDVDFFTTTMRNVIGEGGGAMHAILGTLIITALAALISVPIGMLTAIYLVEYGGGRLARAVTFLVDVMTGIPSIVAGLFAYAMFSLIFGPGVRFGIGGAVALSVLMVPVVVRSVEEMLKLVPAELREASYALGVPKWRTILKVVLPAAAAGIGTGVTLAVARVIGETAPLLLIVGTTTSLNLNPFEGRMATLPVFAYFSFVTPGARPEPALDRAWTAALVLMLIVLSLNLVARLIARRFAPAGGR